jgi:hypothetical protein
MPSVDMSQINVSFKGVEATSIFLEPLFINSPLSDYFKIMPMIKNGQQKMLFAGTIENYLRQRVGCGFDPQGSLPITERCISIKPVKGETEQCFDEFAYTITDELLNTGVRKGDMQGTQIMNITIERLMQSAIRQLHLLAFFGDTATGNAEQNFADGVWTKIIPQLVTANLMPRVNSVSGTALGAGQAITLFDDVIDAASDELDAFEASSKIFMTTRAVWRQLQKDLRDGADGSSSFSSEVENGKQVIRFDGIEVKKMSRWDNLAATYMGTVLPGITNNFNLLLLTHRDNLVIGTDVEADINRFDMWYNKDEDTTRTRKAFMFGVDYVHPSLMSAAY